MAELVRHALADVLARGDIQDPILSSHVVTVPEIRMSPDLKLATAYVMPLGGQDEKPVLEALDRNRKALRAEVARRVRDLRYAPDLRFRRDETFDEAARIDALLHSDKVRRDVEAPAASILSHAERAGAAGHESTRPGDVPSGADLRSAPNDEGVASSKDP